MSQQLVSNMFSKKMILSPNYFTKYMICSVEKCIVFQRFSNQLTAENTNESLSKDVEELDKLYKTIEIEARCADREVLNSYDSFVKLSANCLGITISRSWEPFRQIYRRTLLRSAFVKKKYRVQYEFRTYFRNIEFKHMTGSTADTLLEYIERNLPEGVALKVYKTSIEAIPQHITQNNGSPEDSPKN